MKLKRGRPANPQPSIRIVLSGWLHPERDADILAWWTAIPKGQRMAAFKTALRSGGMASETLEAAGDLQEATQDADDILSHWMF